MIGQSQENNDCKFVYSFESQGCSDPSFNADNHEDRALDTAATPNFQSERWYELFWSQFEPYYLGGNPTFAQFIAATDYATANYDPTTDAYISFSNCEYTGTNKDYNRQYLYHIFYEDAHNLMAYSEGCNERVLTTGQAIRMRETIALDCDNVFNTNVTITPQDSTSINNENLINNLQPGLYNIIEQYNDGSTDEKVILKSGN